MVVDWQHHIMKATSLLLLLLLTATAHAEGGSHRLSLRARAAANCYALGTALHLVNRAIERDPTNGEYRSLRGFLLRDIGAERGAIAELERARLSGQAIP